MKRIYVLTILLAGICFISKAGKVNEKYYQIVSVSFQSGINIPSASEQNGKGLMIWDKNDCRFNQMWKTEPQGEYYIIRSKYNNMVITIDDDRIVQTDYIQSDEQHWKIVGNKENVSIISAKNGLALTVDSVNKKLSMVVLEDSEFQKWNLEPAGMEYIQADFNRVMSPEEMKKDLEFYFEKLDAVHVNPYAFVGKDSVEQTKNKLLQLFTEPLRLYEFNREISKLNGLIDGHSNISLNWDYYHSYCNMYGKLLPYDVKLSDNDLYIKSEIDTLNQLKIVSINGIASNDIISEIKQRITPENTRARNLDIESSFRKFLIAVIGLEAPYNIKVADNRGKEGVLKTDGILSFHLPQKKHISHPDYALREYSQDSIAIIEFNTCGYKNYRKWEKDVDSLFNQIKDKNIKYLFLDISRNGGGNSGANNFFLKNINREPNPFAIEFVRRSSLEWILFRSSVDKAKFGEYESMMYTKQFTAKERDKLEKKRGKFQTKEYVWGKEKVTKGFGEEVILIQSDKTYSAAFDMSAWFKYGKIGTIIGTEISQSTEFYCDIVPFLMPNSKMNFRIANNYWKYPDGDLYTGILPDIDLGDDFYKDRYELEDLKKYLELVKDFKTNLE